MTDAQDKILIVDDDPNVIELVGGIFEDTYEVLFATNGKRALDIASSALPDLILLDVMMPKMDGFETCRRLKESPATRPVPVIFLTGKDCAEDEEFGLSLGAVDYIAKPINAPILQARIKTHISLAKARKKLEIQNQDLMEAARVREGVEHIMRHDLKSSISSIISSPRAILMDDNLTEEQRLFLRMMEESALRMLNMVELSLILLKIEFKNYELNLVPVDIAGMIRNIAAENLAYSKPRNISTTILFNGNNLADNDQAFAQAEEILCNSMFLNLYKNAQEASPDGGNILIRINTDKDSQISITNQGEVPQSIRRRFFEKYVTAGKKHGTGLGTYSARIIAEALGGSIELDSSKPGSTTVSVRLPLAQESA